MAYRHHVHRRPVRGVVTGRRPCAEVLARVDAFAVQNVRVQDRRTVPLPQIVGADAQHRAIGERNLELRQQQWPVAVLLTIRDTQRAAIPAVSEQHADGVFTAVQQSRDVERLVVDALAVVGPTRCEFDIDRTGAVDFHVIDAERGDIEARTQNGARHLERTAQRRHLHRRAFAAHQRSPDPACAPVFTIEQAGFEVRRATPRAADPVGIERTHFPPDALARRQRTAAVRDLTGTRRLHATAVPQIAAVGLEQLRPPRGDHVIGGLNFGGPFVVEPPRQTRLALVDADRAIEIFTAKPLGRARHGVWCPSVAASVCQKANAT